MPKNQVSDPITGQEIAFAHLIFSGTVTDCRAAEAVGLNPGTAAHTKSKPRVRDYMLKHRVAVHERLVQQETEEVRRMNLVREQVLTRLWKIANMDLERTRNSMSAQIRAVSTIVAIEGLIPDQPQWLCSEQARFSARSPANRYRCLASRATGQNRHSPDQS
jgi:hypothetical protein